MFFQKRRKIIRFCILDFLWQIQERTISSSPIGEIINDIYEFATKNPGFLSDLIIAACQFPSSENITCTNWWFRQSNKPINGACGCRIYFAI